MMYWIYHLLMSHHPQHKFDVMGHILAGCIAVTPIDNERVDVEVEGHVFSLLLQDNTGMHLCLALAKQVGLS